MSYFHEFYILNLVYYFIPQVIIKIHANYICDILVILFEDIVLLLSSYGSVFLHYIYIKNTFRLWLLVRTAH